MTATTTARKRVQGVYRPGSSHMVGDGFPVRNLFPSNDLGRSISPFLLLDYAGPRDFPPTEQPRGVGEHPHRGFETVTLMYQGAVEHRDSAGNAGTIFPGDVQWMTAASGVVHEEMHEREFARRGGTFEAIQLWVNLPKVLKMSPPRYQTLLNADIPAIELPGGAGTVRVIAGEYQGVRGPAQTFTPVTLYDLRLAAGAHVELALPAGRTSALFVLTGEIAANGAVGKEAELIVFEEDGEVIVVDVPRAAKVLVLHGERIEEPVASYGPFVMNTKAELVQAMADYQAGKMGHLA